MPSQHRAQATLQPDEVILKRVRTRVVVVVVVVRELLFLVTSVICMHLRHISHNIWNHSVCLYVCPSVHMSICHPVRVFDFVRTTSPEPLNHF